MTYLGAFGAAGLGLAAMAYAQHDDAPGLGLIGLLLIGGSIVVGVRHARRGGAVR